MGDLTANITYMLSFIRSLTLVIILLFSFTSLPVSAFFTVDLHPGMNHPQAKLLQQYLNQNGYTVNLFGDGALGYETTIMGPATVAALKRYQAANGISQTGIVGPLTRGALNRMVLNSPYSNPNATVPLTTNILRVNASAEPSTIKPRQSTKIAWSAPNAILCQTPWGKMTTSGTYTTPRLYKTTTYNIICMNATQTATGTVEVIVKNSRGGGGGGGSSPSIPTPPTPPDDSKEVSTGRPVFLPASNETSSPVSLGTLTEDGATTESISLYLPTFGGDTDYDSAAVVEYREAGSSIWYQALDLFRTHEISPAPFAGMIFGLTPNTLYEVRVTVADPDGVEGTSSQTLNIRTKAVPRVVSATPSNTVNVASAAELTAALNSALPGQVILLAPGVYSGTFRVTRKSGTADNPITIRGAADHTSIIDPGGIDAIFVEESDYINLEGLQIRSASRGIVVRNWGTPNTGTTGNVIRNNYINNVTVGIEAKGNGWTGPGHNDLYIVDNVVLGTNVFGDVSSDTWNEEGIVVVGQNVEVAYNTLSGFGDSLGLWHSDRAKSIDIHHNYIVYGGDDGVELDFSLRNVVARENLITNTGDGVSYQYVQHGPGYAFENIIYNIIPTRGPFKVKPEADCNNGVFILQNTSLNAGRAWTNNSGCPTDVYVINNLFTGDTTELDVMRLDTSTFTNLTWDHNAYIYDGRFQFGGHFSTSFAQWQASGWQGENDVLLEGETVFRNAPIFSPQVNLGVQVNPAGNDFRLHVNSSAIDAGKILPTITDGYAGDAPDIGAYESDNQGVEYGARDSEVIIDDPGAPNTAPTITLIGANQITVVEGNPFIDPGATATDAEDGNVTNDIDVSGSVNVSVVGTYTLNYNVEDSEGLAATEASRTVRVIAESSDDPLNQTILDLTPGHWYEVPDSHLRDVVGPLIGGNYPALMKAWNGGAYDTLRNRLIVWGGGHGDYAGNEIYTFDVDTFTWERITEPSNPPAVDTQYAPDGNPASWHTYGALQYMPSIDQFCSFGGSGAWPSGQVPSLNLDCFDFESHSWVRGKPNVTVNGQSAYSAYDPITNTSWSGRGQLTRYNPSTNELDKQTVYDNNLFWSSYYNLVVDENSRLLVAVGGAAGVTGRVYSWDISNLSAAIPAVSRTTTGAGAVQPMNSIVYDPVSDHVIGWNGGANIFLLNTNTWAWATQTPALGNTVTPTAAQTNGTYGRFRYMPDYHALIVVNSIDENVYIYKLGREAVALQVATPSYLTSSSTQNSFLAQFELILERLKDLRSFIANVIQSR